MLEILILIFVAVLDISVCDDCGGQNPAEICIPKDFKNSFPKREADFIEACRNYKSHAKCIFDFEEICNVNEDDLIYGRYLILYIEEICRNESFVYQGIVKHLDCLNTIVYKGLEACQRGSDKYAEVFFMFLFELSEKGIHDASDDPDNTMECLDTVYLDACAASVVGRECGNEPRDAIIDVIQNADFALVKCKKAVVESLTNLVKKFQSIAYQ